jgi:hypothetical protein
MNPGDLSQALDHANIVEQKATVYQSNDALI